MATPAITFLHGQSVAHCRHDINKVFEGYFTLQYMNAGAVDLRVGEQRYRLEGRNFWSCYPGPRIAFHTAAGHSCWSHRYIAFRGAIVDRWQKDGVFPIAPQRPPRGLDYAAPFDELLALAQRTDEWGIRRAVHALEGMLLELAEAREARQPSSPWLEQTLRALHDSVSGEAPDYQRLAEESGMSITTFRRQFRTAMGTSPHDYLVTCRINAARQMLMSTEMPIKQIAATLNYTDVFFFTRQFTKVTGLSPAKFRQSCAG
jgi:AraC-like DNA-binding protein